MLFQVGAGCQLQKIQADTRFVTHYNPSQNPQQNNHHAHKSSQSRAPPVRNQSPRVPPYPQFPQQGSSPGSYHNPGQFPKTRYSQHRSASRMPGPEFCPCPPPRPNPPPPPQDYSAQVGIVKRCDCFTKSSLADRVNPIHYQYGPVYAVPTPQTAKPVPYKRSKKKQPEPTRAVHPTYPQLHPSTNRFSARAHPGHAAFQLHRDIPVNRARY